jgi:hypothetical protein
MAEDLRFKVYIPAIGDLLRESDGTVRYFDDLNEARNVAAEESGFVQPANAPSPGGHDRTFA